MRTDDDVEQAVDMSLPGNRAARIRRDAARVEELQRCGFEGPVWKVFRDQMWVESEPILKGMLRSGKLGHLALRRCAERGISFWIHADDFTAMRSDPAVRDELLVEIQIKALETFHRNALVKGEWNPHHGGARGASCLMTYFIGQCIWEFRRVYVKWARLQQARAGELARSDAFDGTGIAGLLSAAGHLAEPEEIVLATDFEDILEEQPLITQAVVRLTVAGFTDTEIADRVHITHGAVRNRKTRFRTALYQAAREGRIWIPRQLHTAAGDERQQRTAARG